MRRFLLLLSLLLVTLPVRAESPVVPNAHPLCVALDWLAVGEVVPFQPSAYSWEALPTDLRLVRFVYLNNPRLPDEDVSALMFEYSEAAGELWLFPFWSLRVSLDAAGNHAGQHDMCRVRKLRLRLPAHGVPVRARQMPV